MSVNTTQSQRESVRVSRKAFSTACLEPALQFNAWAQLVRNFADVEPMHPVKQGFHGTADAIELPTFCVVSWKPDPVRFHHTEKHINQSGVDHWVLSFVRRGKILGEQKDETFQQAEGELAIKSFAVPYSGCLMTNDLVSVYLRRDDFSDISGLLDRMANRPIVGPLSCLLKDFISTIETSASNLSNEQANVLDKSFRLLLKAAVDPSPDRFAAAATPICAGKFNIARDFIEKNLKSPDLCAEQICQSLKISRRHLYYLFESSGGVAKYIKCRRLESCLRALTDRSDQRLVSTIAFEYGFTSTALFSRQFKAEFGFSPKDARDGPADEPVPNPGVDARFIDWLLNSKPEPIPGTLCA